MHVCKELAAFTATTVYKGVPLLRCTVDTLPIHSVFLVFLVFTRMSLSSAAYSARAARPPERGETARYSPASSPTKGPRGRGSGYPHAFSSSRDPHMTEISYQSAGYSATGNARQHGLTPIDSAGRQCRGPFNAMHESPGSWRAWGGGPSATVGGRGGPRHQDTSAAEYCDSNSGRATGGGSSSRRGMGGMPRSREDEDYYYHKGEREKYSGMRPLPVAASGKRSVSPPASRGSGGGIGGPGCLGTPHNRWVHGGRGSSSRGGEGGGAALGAPAGGGNSGGNNVGDSYRREGTSNQTRNGSFQRGRGTAGDDVQPPRRHFYGDDEYMRAATSASPRREEREKRGNAPYGYSGSREGREGQQGSSWTGDRGGGGRSPGARRRDCSPDYFADAPGSRRERGQGGNNDAYPGDASPRYRGGGGGGRRKEEGLSPIRSTYNGRASRGGGGGGASGAGGHGHSSSNSSRMEGRGDSQERTRRFSVVARGVNPAATPEELKSFFAECVEVKDVYIPLHYKTKQPRGFGFVEFHTRAAMDKALSLMQGEEFLGRRLHLEEAAGEPSTAEEMRRRFQLRRQQWRADGARGGGGGEAYRSSNRGDWPRTSSRGGYRERGVSRSPDRRKGPYQERRGEYYYQGGRERREEDSSHARREDDDIENVHGRRREEDNNAGKASQRRTEGRAISPSFERGRQHPGRASSSSPTATREGGARAQGSSGRGYSRHKRSRSVSSSSEVLSPPYNSRRYGEESAADASGAAEALPLGAREAAAAAADRTTLEEKEEGREGAGGDGRGGGVDDTERAEALSQGVIETAGTGAAPGEVQEEAEDAGGGRGRHADVARGGGAGVRETQDEGKEGDDTAAREEAKDTSRGGSSSSVALSLQLPAAGERTAAAELGDAAAKAAAGATDSPQHLGDAAASGTAGNGAAAAGGSGALDKYADTTTSTAAPAETSPAACRSASSETYLSTSASTGSPAATGGSGSGAAAAECPAGIAAAETRAGGSS